MSASANASPLLNICSGFELNSYFVNPFEPSIINNAFSTYVVELSLNPRISTDDISPSRSAAITGVKVFTLSSLAHSTSISKLGVPGGKYSHSGSHNPKKLPSSQGQSGSKISTNPSPSSSILLLHISVLEEYTKAVTVAVTQFVPEAAPNEVISNSQKSKNPPSLNATS